MKNIFIIGEDIVKEITRTGNPNLLFELFAVRTQIWKYHIIHNEFETDETFGDLRNLESDIAYHLIATAMEIVNTQTDEELITTALSLLLICVEMSNTTELPKEATNHTEMINNKINSLYNDESKGFWRRIKKWYRLSH